MTQMLIETCFYMNDRYVDVNNVPKKSWEDIIKDQIRDFIDNYLDKPILAYNVTVHFCPRKEFPKTGDRRKMAGVYESMGNNSCMVYIYDKVSAKTMNYIIPQMLKCIKKDFTDTTVHYNEQGNPCRCERSKDYAV
jgi:hypothetical protein